MQTIQRPTTRCPEPHCGGQLMVQHDYDGWDVTRYLACSLCGREPREPRERAAGAGWWRGPAADEGRRGESP